MELPLRAKRITAPQSCDQYFTCTFNFHFHALEKEMATHSSILAWRIPGTGGAWWAAIYGVAQSQTRLKQLSSSSSRGKNLSCYSRCMSLFALFCTQAELYKFPLFLCLFLFTGRDSFWNWVHTWRMKPSSLPAGLEFSYFQCNQDLSKA